MKKLTLLAVVGTFGLFGLSASAKLPSGLESVNIKATVLVQGDNTVSSHKITTDDILYLIDLEYGTSYSKLNGGKGYQLVSYGVGKDITLSSTGEDEFAVADKDGIIVLADASYDGDDYYLYLYPYADTEEYVYKETKTGDNYTVCNVSVYYNSSDDNDYFQFSGLMTDNVNWELDNESYSLNNGQGYIEFDDALTPFGDSSFYGIITSASVSGSGKDVYPFDD